MEVKIGVKGASRELVVETDLSPEEVSALVRTAASDPQSMFEIEDVKGRKVLVPAEKLAFVEIGEQEARRVGFGAM